MDGEKVKGGRVDAAQCLEAERLSETCVLGREKTRGERRVGERRRGKSRGGERGREEERKKSAHKIFLPLDTNSSSRKHKCKTRVFFLFFFWWKERSWIFTYISGKLK